MHLLVVAKCIAMNHFEGLNSSEIEWSQTQTCLHPPDKVGFTFLFQEWKFFLQKYTLLFAELLYILHGRIIFPIYTKLHVSQSTGEFIFCKLYYPSFYERNKQLVIRAI